MKLSMMSYTMSRQPGFDLVRMFKLSQELKLQGVDLTDLYSRKPAELRHMAEDHGIPVVAHTFGADLNQKDAKAQQEAVDKARHSLDAAAELGAPVAMLVTPGKNGEPRDEARKRWIAGLRAVARHAGSCGVVLTVENFPGKFSSFVTAADFLEAQKEVPGLKLTFDSGNAAGGEDPVESFRQCAKHVVHSHFKDWIRSDSGGCEMLNGETWRAELIGKGVVNHAGVISAMREAKYKGFINIEYEGNEIKADEAVRRAAAYLRDLGCE